MSANKYLANILGAITEIAGLQVSTGAPDANKIPAVDSSGRLDISLMPVGVIADTISLATGENLSGGALVNIYNDTGTAKARNADNSNGRKAHGFVIAATTAPAVATIYFNGPITGLSALTPGTQMFLGVAGAATATAPTASSSIVQQIGVAGNATEILFNPQMTITLA